MNFKVEEILMVVIAFLIGYFLRTMISGGLVEGYGIPFNDNGYGCAGGSPDNRGIPRETKDTPEETKALNQCELTYKNAMEYSNDPDNNNCSGVRNWGQKFCTQEEIDINTRAATDDRIRCYEKICNWYV